MAFVSKIDTHRFVSIGFDFVSNWDRTPMYHKILILKYQQKNGKNMYVIIVLLEIKGNAWLYVWLGMRTCKFLLFLLSIDQGW